MMRSRRTVLALVATLLAAGCGHAAVEAGPPVAPKAATQIVAPAEPDVAVYEDPVDARVGSVRLPGDFVVFRYTGSFRKTPLTLTERVVAVEGNVLVVDFTIAEGKKEETLRVRFDQTPGGKGGVIDVARLDKGIAKAATKNDFETLMAKTVLAADANEADLGSEAVSVAVSGKTISAKRTSYRVVVGDKGATMSVTQSDDFVWGDIGGEIKGDDGAVLYRAELLESGSGSPVATK